MWSEQQHTHLESVGKVPGNDRVKPDAPDRETPQSSEYINYGHHEHPSVTVPSKSERVVVAFRGLRRFFFSFANSLPRCFARGGPEAVVAQPERGQGKKKEPARGEDQKGVYAFSQVAHDGGTLADLRKNPQFILLAEQLPADVGVELDKLDALRVSKGGPRSPAPGFPRKLQGQVDFSEREETMARVKGIKCFCAWRLLGW